MRLGHPFGYRTHGDRAAYCIYHWRKGDCPPQSWWLRQIVRHRRAQRARLSPRGAV